MSTLENSPATATAETPPSPAVNRLGQFKISAALLRVGWLNLLPLFAHMVIVRAEFIFASDVIEYTAQSDLFEESPDHCVPPEYEIVVKRKDDGTLDLSATKVLSLADIQLKPKAT